MFVSVTARTSKTVSVPEQKDEMNTGIPASSQETTRRSSRKRTASTRYDNESFTELHEEQVAPEEKDPKTPQENEENNAKKRRTVDSSDDEYVPEENNDQCTQVSDISDEDHV